MPRREEPRKAEVTRNELDKSLKELNKKREKLEEDRQQRLGELRILFPLTALLAPAILLVLGGFAAYFFDNTQFSYAILSYFLAFSGVFMLLAYHFRVHLITTEYQFESRYNEDHLREYAALRRPELKTPPSVKDAIEIISEEERAEKVSLARNRRWGGYSFACGLLMLAGAFLVLYIAVQKNPFLTINLSAIHSVGVALFVISYFAFSVVGYRSLRALAQSSVESIPAGFHFIDYLFSIVPLKVRVGDTKSVEVDLYREREDCEFIPQDAYVEVELESAGVKIAAENKRRLPACFHSLQVLWSCQFINTGKHTINFTVNKVLPKEEIKEVYFASFYTVQVVSPYRASLNAALTVAISALSALTAFFNILHPI